MTKKYIGGLSGQAGDQEQAPDYEKAYREMISDIGRQNIEKSKAKAQEFIFYSDGTQEPIKTEEVNSGNFTGGFPENPPMDEGETSFPGSTDETIQKLGVKNPWRKDPNDPRGSL